MLLRSEHHDDGVCLVLPQGSRAPQLPGRLTTAKASLLPTLPYDASCLDFRSVAQSPEDTREVLPEHPIHPKVPLLRRDKEHHNRNGRDRDELAFARCLHASGGRKVAEVGGSTVGRLAFGFEVSCACSNSCCSGKVDSECDLASNKVQGQGGTSKSYCKDS